MRYLGMPANNHQHWLTAMNQSEHVGAAVDYYNQGVLIDQLESQVSTLLNKPKALFFNKGTVCQLAVLKTICEHKNNNLVALHPQSHIAFDEEDAYIHLMGLAPSLIGQINQPLLAKDLEHLTTKPAVLTVELPLRRAGFKLPEWQELLDMRAWCQANKVHFHMDGARLWESTHYYQRSLSEIAELFDSAYVSLYKGIGALSGAVLAGEKTFLQACEVWRNRMGSNMYSAFPTLITGLEGLKNNLPKISTWVERTHSISNQLKKIPGLEISTPQTNGFQIHLNGHLETINKHLASITEKTNLKLCQPFAPTRDKQVYFTEIQVGLGSEDISDTEIINFFTELMGYKQL